jgi:hypothetical protein
MLFRPHWATVGLIVVLSGGSGVILLALASAATSRGEHHAGVRILVVLVALALISLAIRSARAGIHVSSRGVTVRGWLRDTYIDWSDVRGFGVATAHFAHGVYVERRDTSRIRCGLFSDGPEVHLLRAADHNERVVADLEEVRRRVR